MCDDDACPGRTTEGHRTPPHARLATTSFGPAMPDSCPAPASTPASRRPARCGPAIPSCSASHDAQRCYHRDVPQICSPVVLKPGLTLDTLPGPRPSDAVGSGIAPLIRGRALIVWDPRQPGRRKARRHRHRSDHAGGRLRLRVARHARRALEGGIRSAISCPTSGPGCTAARPSSSPASASPSAARARIEPGRVEGHRRGSRPADGDHLRRQHGRHLPP